MKIGKYQVEAGAISRQGLWESVYDVYLGNKFHKRLWGATNTSYEAAKAYAEAELLNLTETDIKGYDIDHTGLYR